MLDLSSVGGRCGSLQQTIVGELMTKPEFPEAVQRQKEKAMGKRDREIHNVISKGPVSEDFR